METMVDYSRKNWKALPTSKQLSISVTVPDNKFIPGYGGFCPTVRSNYGITYSNATRSFYQESRQDILNTSRKQFKGTGENSTAVVNSAVVVQPKPQQKKQDGDLWITPLPYTLHHNSSRREKMLEFDKSAQVHRQFYKDHSGMVYPNKDIRQRAQSAPPNWRMQMLQTVHKYDPLPPLSPSLSSISYVRQTSSLNTQFLPFERRGSVRERATRDSFFQKR